MNGLTPEDLIRAYPDFDFIIEHGSACNRYMVSMYKAFYEFAGSQCHGRVLQAGCGTGFGTPFLARRSERTIGIDVKDKLVRYASHHYPEPNLTYVAMDATKLGWADRSFDVVVADELLEHLPAHRPFLSEATRVLKEDGLFVCATVNRRHTFGGSNGPLNRNHFREYDAAEFAAELGNCFRDVELVGQGYGEKFRRYLEDPSARRIEGLLLRLKLKHRIPVAWRTWVRSLITGVRANESGMDEFRVAGGEVESALYLVALARGPRVRRVV